MRERIADNSPDAEQPDGSCTDAELWRLRELGPVERRRIATARRRDPAFCRVVEERFLAGSRPFIRGVFVRALAGRLAEFPSPDMALVPALLDTAATIALAAGSSGADLARARWGR
jgi:hypothetical protein